MGPASTLWPDSTLDSSLLIPMWPVGILGVNWLHGGVFLFLCHPRDEETASCGQTAPWSHLYSSQCDQSAPLVLTGYRAMFFFLVRHPSDGET